jgi:PBP1b-binding outer membrane lipoprotein LpoB
MKTSILFLALLLAGCGASRGLTPAEGQKLPPAPYGATATPTPNDLLTPNTQARPGRSDELLRNSDERRSDEFDLPPR